eukprot:TRINITY_DN785_c0_g1_i4.p1 TRINITY_DN785_c0_g1~~TRINITY_DN785_c0_g1_i4.p1  ORF type:complete len:435 (-),score=86.25 TRINITY_DN785_c0_g1_i4:1855-3159(-)
MKRKREVCKPKESKTEKNDSGKKQRTKTKSTKKNLKEYCICKEPDGGRDMINCDGCKDWFHYECVGITTKVAPTIGEYFCLDCMECNGPPTKRSKKRRRASNTSTDVEFEKTVFFSDTTANTSLDHDDVSSEEEEEDREREAVDASAASAEEEERNTLAFSFLSDCEETATLEYINRCRNNKKKLLKAVATAEEKEQKKKKKDWNSYPYERRKEFIQVWESLFSIIDSSNLISRQKKKELSLHDLDKVRANWKDVLSIACEVVSAGKQITLVNRRTNLNKGTKRIKREGLEAPKTLNFKWDGVTPIPLLAGTQLIKIGKIYTGKNNQQKYWSRRGSLYNHPYPVGYTARKKQWGRWWTMEITEGAKGPNFTLKADDDKPNGFYEGPTPTQPWTKACQKSCSPGTRVSGPRFFGFSDQKTQKLLADLVAESKKKK